MKNTLPPFLIFEHVTEFNNLEEAGKAIDEARKNMEKVPYIVVKPEHYKDFKEQFVDFFDEDHLLSRDRAGHLFGAEVYLAPISGGAKFGLVTIPLANVR